MKPVIYNLASIRPPITGIGRYTIELLRGGLDAKRPIIVAHGGELIDQQKLPPLLARLERAVSPAGHSWRQRLGQLPFSRQLYRANTSRKFGRLARSALAGGAIYHDINYSPVTQASSTIATVYDLSHRHYPETHPQDRVRFMDKYLRKLVAGNSQIITISQTIKAELIQDFNLDAERVHVTPLAADKNFHPRARSECQLQLSPFGLGYKQYLLSVGTLEPRKNLVAVLAAYSALDTSTKNAFPLVIAGPYGWKSGKLENQIDRLHQSGHVIRIGFVPQQQLPFLYAGAAAFVYPSLYEGFGLPLLEAMQSGCPCVTSNTGALAEVSAGHAIEVDPLNVEQLALKLNSLLQYTDLNSHYTQAGQQRARAFSWSATVAKTHQIYNGL